MKIEKLARFFLLGRASTKKQKNLKSIKKKIMKTISEMSIEELREALVNAQKAQKVAEERAQKAEEEAETFKSAWQYQDDEIKSYREKIASLKTFVNLL